MIEDYQRQLIQDLIIDYSNYLDDCRYDEWLTLFDDECVYKIIPRENYMQGLPLCLMLCSNKNMLRDRIVSAREANIYRIHVNKHVVNHIRILGAENGTISAEANFAVFGTDDEGNSRIFGVGRYADKFVFVNNKPRIREKVVILDTASVPTSLPVPL